MHPLSLAVLIGLLLLLGIGLIFLCFGLLQLMSKAWVVLIVSVLGYLVIWLIIRLLSSKFVSTTQ